MKTYRASEKILILWYLKLFLGFFAFTVLYSVTLSIFSTSWWALVFLSVVSYLMITLIYFPLRINSFKFSISLRELRVRSGVFVISSGYFSISKVQYISYKQGIFERMLGLSRIHVHSVGSDKILYGLTETDAKEIAKLILKGLYGEELLGEDEILEG